jgi:hypothetical protein
LAQKKLDELPLDGICRLKLLRMQCQHHPLAPEISSFAPKSHREEIDPRPLPTHPKAEDLRPHDR